MTTKGEMVASPFSPFTFPMTIIGKDFVSKVIPLVESAMEKIEIIVFDWRLPIDEHKNPVAELLSALQEATTRGILVRVLVVNQAIGERLKKKGLDVRYLHTQKLMHCKLMLIDTTLAVIGSHNYTTSAFTQNMEASVAVRLPQRDNEFAIYFRNLWGI